MGEMPSRTLYSPELVTDLFSKVKGTSALAKLSAQKGVPFVGTKEFTFTMDQEVDIVAENGSFTHGGISFAPVTMTPVKFEYGARIPREYMYASEEEKVDYLSAFNDGFSKKVARGLDIAAIHGFNPRTGAASAVIGNNCFDKVVTQTVTYAPATADDNLDDAIAMIGDADLTGIAISKTFASAMSKIRDGVDGPRAYPEFRFGGAPSNIGDATVAVNSTVSKAPTGAPDHAVVGDFANAFKWGFGKEIELLLIPYGDPDGTNEDLQKKDQVYLRGIAYVGWGILAPEYFARVVAAGV